MGFCSGVSKCLLFILNIVCFLLGLGLIIVGVLYILEVTDITGYLDEFSSIFGLIPILLIIIGAIIFIIAFFGCCGACINSSCMLITYAVALVIILVLQIALIIFIFVTLNDTDGSWYGYLRDTIETIFRATDHVSQEIVDMIQSQLGCCGEQGPPLLNVPDSCCKSLDPCIPFDQGCVEAFYDFFMETLYIIGIVVAGLAGVKFICVILAICVAMS